MLFSVISFLFLFFSLISSEIISYRNTIQYGNPYFLQIPKYSAKDVPHWAPGKGRNIIDGSSVTLRIDECENSDCKGSIDYFIFLSPGIKGKSWIELWDSPNLCCTSDMVAKGSCASNEINSILIPPEIKESYKETLHLTGPNSISLNDDSSYNIAITKSGMYVMVFGVCDPKSENIFIQGNVESINPYGFVPADVFPNIFFFGIMSGLYLLFGAGWLVACTTYSEELIYLQYWITGALALGMIETTLLFSHYLDWNEHGVVSVSLLTSALIFGVTKRALSRVVILLVSMGYSVVRQSIGEDMNRVICLGIAYTLLSSIYTLTASIPAGAKYVDDSQFQSLFSLVVMLLATTDTVFYMWILSSLNNLIITLRSRKQTIKFDLYSQFRIILMACVTLAVVWAVYGGFLVAGDSSERNWMFRWTLEAFSELIYFVIFVSVAILWAPYKNNQRYVSYVELSPYSGEDSVHSSQQNGNSVDAEVEFEAEYGGQLEEDPFQGTGALDPTMAILKKN